MEKIVPYGVLYPDWIRNHFDLRILVLNKLDVHSEKRAVRFSKILDLHKDINIEYVYQLKFKKFWS
jgi:hypothetical protein